jgi:hypothetical protein
VLEWWRCQQLVARRRVGNVKNAQLRRRQGGRAFGNRRQAAHFSRVNIFRETGATTDTETGTKPHVQPFALPAGVPRVFCKGKRAVSRSRVPGQIHPPTSCWVVFSENYREASPVCGVSGSPRPAAAPPPPRQARSRRRAVRQPRRCVLDGSRSVRAAAYCVRRALDAILWNSPHVSVMGPLARSPRARELSQFLSPPTARGGYLYLLDRICALDSRPERLPHVATACPRCDNRWFAHRQPR